MQRSRSDEQSSSPRASRAARASATVAALRRISLPARGVESSMPPSMPPTAPTAAPSPPTAPTAPIAAPSPPMAPTTTPSPLPGSDASLSAAVISNSMSTAGAVERRRHGCVWSSSSRHAEPSARREPSFRIAPSMASTSGVRWSRQTSALGFAEEHMRRTRRSASRLFCSCVVGRDSRPSNDGASALQSVRSMSSKE